MTEVFTTELEYQIFQLEEIRVIIRSAPDSRYKSYPYTRRSSSSTSITEWYHNRLKPLIGSDEAIIVAGDGTIPHGRTHIETIRNSYTR